jgi:tryptophan-rich sensory protein
MSAGARRDALALAAFLGLCFAVAALGGWVTQESVGTWYRTLRKPAFNPPDWVFGPVWMLLYAMIAVAGWRAWRKRARPRARAAFQAYGAQLALNLLWSFLFFGARQVGLALVDIAALLGAIVLTIALFARLDRMAAALLLPYAAWVAFAAALNFAIWRLN